MTKLTPAQARFVLLHQKRLVEKTQVLFGGYTIRATAEDGERATVRSDEAAELVDRGIMAVRHGAYVLTEEGKAL